MPENFQEKFSKLMESQGMSHLDKPAAWYVVKYFDPSLPESQSAIYDKFRTKADRYKWYKENAMEIIQSHGGRFELPEEPVSEDDL